MPIILQFFKKSFLLSIAYYCNRCCFLSVVLHTVPISSITAPLTRCQIPYCVSFKVFQSIAALMQVQHHIRAKYSKYALISPEKSSTASALQGSSDGSVVKNLPANAGDMGLIPSLEDALEKKWQPILLPGESHEQRSLVGYTVHRVSKSLTRHFDSIHCL